MQAAMAASLALLRELWGPKSDELQACAEMINQRWDEIRRQLS